MKRIIVILATILTLIALVACSGSDNTTVDATPTAEVADAIVVDGVTYPEEYLSEESDTLSVGQYYTSVRIGVNARVSSNEPLDLIRLDGTHARLKANDTEEVVAYVTVMYFDGTEWIELTPVSSISAQDITFLALAFKDGQWYTSTITDPDFIWYWGVSQ